MGINRIRLEFKGESTQNFGWAGPGINRIRLEFKGRWHARTAVRAPCINRIRLEFKVTFPIPVNAEDRPY